MCVCGHMIYACMALVRPCMRCNSRWLFPDKKRKWWFSWHVLVTQHFLDFCCFHQIQTSRNGFKPWLFQFAAADNLTHICYKKNEIGSNSFKWHHKHARNQRIGWHHLINSSILTVSIYIVIRVHSAPAGYDDHEIQKDTTGRYYREINK